MSVLVKGLEMPKSCSDCKIRLSVGCCGNLPQNTRMPNCPLVPVSPHYDLIDHNALKIAIMDCDAETRIDFLKHAMDCINKAPVVIPSDMPTYEAEEE